MVLSRAKRNIFRHFECDEKDLGQPSLCKFALQTFGAAPYVNNTIIPNTIKPVVTPTKTAFSFWGQPQAAPSLVPLCSTKHRGGNGETLSKPLTKEVEYSEI